MRYRPSITYLVWLDGIYCFDLNEFCYFDKYISETVPLKMLHREVAFVAGSTANYLWLDRVI